MKANIATSLKLSIAVALAFNGAIAFAEETADTYNNSNWQSPLATEFNALDTTGNGLLLPNEASKGKAFNKKTFAQADTDHDGYIDVNEYTYFKTGARPDVVKPITSALSTDASNTGANEANLSDASQAKTTPEGDELMNSEATSSEKKTVGHVIDDSIITAKAKAEILKAPDLKSLQISVETLNGEVILSGFVDSVASKMQAAEVVSKIEGVKSVNNSLAVKM